MLARMVELVRGVTEVVRIVAAPGKYAEFGVTIVEDRWPGEGPLGGIVTALLHTQNNEPDCVWNLILSCDMPFLTADWVKFSRSERRRALLRWSFRVFAWT
jgi:molybdopterin-guanine dinucleotide biosynthesis protein A